MLGGHWENSVNRGRFSKAERPKSAALGEQNTPSENMNKKGKLERLPKGSALEYAPENEQGVVFLFAGLAKHHGMRVESIQAGFPDCTAVKDGRRVRVEFEYRSKSFVTHGHDEKKCDVIVCWIHDWLKCPKRIQVIELCRDFGLGFNVWFQAVRGEPATWLPEKQGRCEWSVASQASPGDLILFYHASPEKCIRSVFRVEERVKKTESAAWKRQTGLKSLADFWTYITPVAHLKTPIHLSELREHRAIGQTGHVRRSLIGRWRATPHWPDLFRMIIERNPSAKKALAKYRPELFT